MRQVQDFGNYFQTAPTTCSTRTMVAEELRIAKEILGLDTSDPVEIAEILESELAEYRGEFD